MGTEGQPLVSIRDVPPQDIEAEQALLGCVLIDPCELHTAVSLGITPDAFYMPMHRTHWKAVVAAYGRSSWPTCDAPPLVVFDVMRKWGNMGGWWSWPALLWYLVQCMEAAEGWTALEAAYIVADMAVRRRAARGGQRIIERAYNQRAFFDPAGVIPWK